jgi:hypothetical protein
MMSRNGIKLLSHDLPHGDQSISQSDSVLCKALDEFLFLSFPQQHDIARKGNIVAKRFRVKCRLM